MSTTRITPTRMLVGYDGSPAASAAIEAGAQLFPRAHAWVAHMWTPPFASTSLRDRLWTGPSNIDEFVEAIEREGKREADRMAAIGVTLAGVAGWDAEPLVVRSYGGEGLRFAELSEKVDADVVLIGSRGLGGAQALLGSVSDMVVHYTDRPVLVVPHPLLIAEFAALANGPVLVGYDGSPGAQTALATATRLFPTRPLLLATVDDGQATGDTTGPPQEGDDTAVTRLQLRGGRGMHGRSVAAALVGCARSRAAGVLVVGTRGRSAVREILLGSVAMATLHHAYLPVLVVPSGSPAAGDSRATTTSSPASAAT
ncbi:universal stress protein [Dactylosporangium sp. NPDC000555]|uniref:universal stress protein n=1 Tax=Dactylosporangium sp. NPDC000555 TaxID=3154260 RepID=UPI003317EC19